MERSDSLRFGVGVNLKIHLTHAWYEKKIQVPVNLKGDNGTPTMLRSLIC